MRRTELTRSAPMRRTAFPARSSAPKPNAKPKTARDTGPTKATRDAVLARDSHTCQRCGRYLPGLPYSLQHRLPRGRQGSNTMANLVTVCGSATTPDMCHDWMEHEARQRATAEGWLVPSWRGVTPENWPVLRFGQLWSMPGVTGWTEVEPHPLQQKGAA
jgi:hypothetical protein